MVGDTSHVDADYVDSVGLICWNGPACLDGGGGAESEKNWGREVHFESGLDCCFEGEVLD